MINSWPVTPAVRDSVSLRHLWMPNRLGTKVRIANTVSALVIAAIMVAAAPAARAQQSIVGVASVIDGDTIEVHGARIRMHGIDAPESRQECIRADSTSWRCGQQAALALADRIGRLPVTCRRTDTDHYGRMIAICFKGEEDLNAWMVAGGWAVAYRRYSRDYVRLEEHAKTAGTGIWSSQFVMPWDWRRGQRIVARDVASERPEGCDIKGNINSRGDKIYHVPGGRWYDQTRIDENRGQRWFCSEEEAQAEGWRRSRQ